MLKNYHYSLLVYLCLSYFPVLKNDLQHKLNLMEYLDLTVKSDFSALNINAIKHYTFFCEN